MGEKLQALFCIAFFIVFVNEESNFVTLGATAKAVFVKVAVSFTPAAIRDKRNDSAEFRER